KLFNSKKLELSTDDTPSKVMRRSFDSQYLQSLDPFNASRRITLNQLSGYVIPTLGDRVEMANSVECRTPFLDRDLLDFTGKVPPHFFMDIDQLREKHLLKEAFRDLLPPFLEHEHKHPFLSQDWHH